MNSLVYVDLIYNSIRKNPGRFCLHIKREGHYHSWTYEEFHRDLNRLTGLLKKQGLKKGLNAIVIGENTPEWTIAYHSIILTGACTVPVDPNITASEIESIFSTTEAKVVFCTPVFLNLFRMFKEKYDFLEKIILLNSKSEEKEPSFNEYITSGDDEKEAFSTEFKPDDPMVIIFTSGTTGKAKGVVLSQKNFTAVNNYAVPRMKLSSEDTVCAVLPLHHVFGFAACIAGPLAAGMDIVFVPYVKGPLILEALQEKGVTWLPAVPKMISLFYDSIMHNVKKKGPVIDTIFTGMKMVSATAGETLGTVFRRGLFSSVHKSFGKLRLFISGGAALNKKHWNAFRLLGFDIVEGYGLTETFGPIILCPVDDSRSGSVGISLNGNEVSIFEPNESGIGEVLLRGTCVFKGYYKNDKLTNEVLESNGWFHTGDLGYLGKDGFLYLNGRKKDVIVLDTGKNVYPDELEDYYGASPHIEEIGIFGVRRNEGEIVAAAVVPSREIRKSCTVQQATDLIYEELLRLGKSLPVYRRISDFVTLYTPLPRTTTRKLKKHDLLKLYSSIKRRIGSKSISEEQLSVLEMALMETEEYLGIVSGITFTSPKIELSIINPRSHLEIDLGLDSLKKIELLSRLEQRFSITVPEDIFNKMETVGDLVSLIRERKKDGGKTSVESVMGLKERILSDSVEFIKIPPSQPLLRRAISPLLHKIATGIKPAGTQGAEHLPLKGSPLIFVANHGHILDIFWILNSLPESIRRNTFYLGDKEAQAYPPLPYALHRHNMLKLLRVGDPIEVLKVSLAVVRNSKNLIIFPEGAISRTGVIGQFKSGVGLIAKETNASIVPVKITASAQSSAFGDSHRQIRFGKSISFAELVASGKLHHESSAEEIAGNIRSLISSM